jgi:hypothetical protein
MNWARPSMKMTGPGIVMTSQAMVDRYANGVGSTFLMGRPVGFDIEDVMRLVKSDSDKAAQVRAPIHLPDKEGLS